MLKRSLLTFSTPVRWFMIIRLRLKPFAADANECFCPPVFQPTCFIFGCTQDRLLLAHRLAGRLSKQTALSERTLRDAFQGLIFNSIRLFWRYLFRRSATMRCSFSMIRITAQSCELDAHKTACTRHRASCNKIFIKNLLRQKSNSRRVRTFRVRSSPDSLWPANPPGSPKLLSK